VFPLAREALFGRERSAMAVVEATAINGSPDVVPASFDREIALQHGLPATVRE
jgi:hypothetical protein